MAVGELAEHALGMWEHEPVVIGDRQRTGPRIEQLEGARPVPQLDVDERDRMVGEAVHDAVPQRFVGVHQRLGVLVRATGGALDQIAANGERGTCERQQRHLARQLGDQQVDRVGDIGDVVGIEWAQPIEIGGATNRLTRRPGRCRA